MRGAWVVCALFAHPLRDRAASCVLGPRTFARTLRRMSSLVDSAVHKIALADGRALAYREYGDPQGEPVIFVHGNLNSRLFVPSWGASQEDAERAGARVLALDRPGYGASSPHPGRRYPHFAADVDALASALDLSRFACVGYSSGGPHALAVAAHGASGRLSVCGLVSSDGPYRRIGEGIVTEVYGVDAVDEACALTLCADNCDALRASYGALKKEDRRAMALADLDEAVRQGIDGPAQDAVLETADDWGFAFRDVKVPVLLWHGADDESVPVKVAEFFAAELAHAPITASVIDGESHSMIRRHWRAVLSAVVERSRGASA